MIDKKINKIKRKEKLTVDGRRRIHTVKIVCIISAARTAQHMRLL
jgi:hypothetical protein